MEAMPTIIDEECETYLVRYIIPILPNSFAPFPSRRLSRKPNDELVGALLFHVEQNF